MSWLLLLSMFAALPVAAQPADAAFAAYAAALPGLSRAAPDVVVDRLRQRITAILAPLPSFDPGSRAVEIAVNRAWPALQRRCPAATSIAPSAALALADDVLREAGAGDRATPQDRGGLAAAIGALDGRLCRCTDRSSLALAADCAS